MNIIFLFFSAQCYSCKGDYENCGRRLYLTRNISSAMIINCTSGYCLSSMDNTGLEISYTRGCSPDHCSKWSEYESECAGLDQNRICRKCCVGNLCNNFEFENGKSMEKSNLIIIFVSSFLKLLLFLNLKI